ncbi:hypothetical protein [Aliagarivorans marinus]|uniref:hypothetical protein n=1 Tax=Aliagarivorans marinus TaxID=561965 RepID=UPI00041B4545|nr:hypothetical protein [Aliagarivorans marinus]
MKLSRRAWNNVIILTVAAMILTFRFFELRPGEQPAEISAGRLLPEGAVILQLNLPDRTIERHGTEWHVESTSNAAVNASPITTIDAWMHAELSPWEQAVGGAAQTSQVSVYLASLSEPLQLTLFELPERRVISNWQGQLLELDPGTYELLFAPQ